MAVSTSKRQNIQPVDTDLTGTDLTTTINDRIRRINQALEVVTPAPQAVVVAPAGIYDMWMFFQLMPTSGAVIFAGTFPRPVSFLGNWVGSYGAPVQANPTATATFTVKKNGSSIGTIVISTGGVYTFATTSGAAESFATADNMTITAPSPADATLAGYGWTIVGAR